MNWWDRLVDAANLVTMICAVIGVVLAAVLGWVAIHVAKSGNDTARKESLYGQVDDVLNAALDLTAACSEEPRSSETFEPEVRRASEAFGSRLRVLEALGLLRDSQDAVERADVFADGLTDLASANGELHRVGRTVLSDALLAGVADDHTDELLGRWIARYCTTFIQNYDENHEPLADVAEEIDVRLVPDAFESDARTAEHLRELLGRDVPTMPASTSLRLLIPWVQVRLGLLIIGRSDGDPVRLLSTRPAPEPVYGPDRAIIDVVHPTWRVQELGDWLDNWRPAQVHDDINGQFPVMAFPEELADQLLVDLRAAFLDQVVNLVKELRAAVTEQNNVDAGWMRKALGLV